MVAAQLVPVDDGTESGFKWAVDSLTFYQELGRRMSARRTGLSMTQAEVGEVVGTSRAWVANVESGRQRLQVHQLYAVAGALGCDDLEELISTHVPKVASEDQVQAPGASEVERAQIESLVRNAVAAARPKGRRR